MSGDDGEQWISLSELQDLVGIDEIRDLLGRGSPSGERVARNTAVVRSKTQGFPLPLIVYPAVGTPRIRLWRRRDVEAWFDRERPGWRDRAGG